MQKFRFLVKAILEPYKPQHDCPRGKLSFVKSAESKGGFVQGSGSEFSIVVLHDIA